MATDLFQSQNFFVKPYGAFEVVESIAGMKQFSDDHRARLASGVKQANFGH
jgi:hypothetical protein